MQLKARFAMYNLHNGDGIKIDMAVKGDSFASHNEDYLRQYTKELYDYLNGCESTSLAEAAALQEYAQDRCVTYKIETRPDQIDEHKCRLFMELGITTVEIGVQSLDDKVLVYNERGHDSSIVRSASALLRKYGFEVVYQMMVGLPGSSIEIDKKILCDTLWKDEYAPDAIKIYPCILLKREYVWQERLRKLYYDGKWTPITESEYINLLYNCYEHIPSYVHVNRIQRIIPPEKIEVGVANEIDRSIFNHISTCLWQRSPAQQLKDLDIFIENYKIISYPQGCNRMCFEVIIHNNIVAGYARVDRRTSKSVIIRDIRILGNMSCINDHNYSKLGFQHIGMGTSLLQAIEKYAISNNIYCIFIKPSFGTISWFKQRGFVKISDYFYVKITNPLTSINDCLTEFYDNYVG